MADENYWEATQAILQGETPLVKRPKLTEALLKKPPFRFLHDVVSEVGALKRMFTAPGHQISNCHAGRAWAMLFCRCRGTQALRWGCLEGQKRTQRPLL